MAHAKYLFTFVLIHVILQFSDGNVSDKYFRSDYEYIEEMQSFYKVHTLWKTWNDAKRKCNLEGASLWYPRNQCEADTVLCYLNETQSEFDKIHVGISAKFAKGAFRTVDGTLLTSIYNKWKQGEPNDEGGQEDCVAITNQGKYSDIPCTVKLPFICKKTLATLQWNDKCNVSDLGYEYSEELGKCYKFHLTPLYWKDAFALCDGEQSNLAIVNSEAESKYLRKINEKAATVSVAGTYLQGQIHVGFAYDTEYGDWRTISGDSLEKSGYSVWSSGQPDGGENERCGAMFLGNGQLNDIGCEAHKCFFVCEREDEILNVSKDEC